MLTRPTLMKRPDQAVADAPKGQARPIEERFHLRVDGQIKRSFASKELAVAAGAAVIKAYPMLMVTIVDTEVGNVEAIKA